VSSSTSPSASPSLLILLILVLLVPIGVYIYFYGSCWVAKNNLGGKASVGYNSPIEAATVSQQGDTGILFHVKYSS